MKAVAFAERLEDAGTGEPFGKPVGSQFSSVVVAAKAGAEWAWTLLYRSLSKPLLGYLRANGARDPDGLLGDVFLQLARNLATFEGDEDAFRSWAFLIAHHRVLDERRSWRRKPAVSMAQPPDAVGGSTEDDVMAGLVDRDLVDALQSLTPQQRDVVLLRVFGDLSLGEVSVVVNRPVSAVKALQRRAYEQLRKKISDDRYPGEPPRR